MARKHRPKMSPDRWAEAKRLCSLNEEDLRMARELGFTPAALIRNIPNRQQRWKAPVKEWIRSLYEERFGAARARPQSRPAEPAPAPDEDFGAGSLWDLDPDPDWDDDAPPGEEEIEEENQLMIRRQLEFRAAAAYVVAEWARLPEVQRVALFGSVAAPLEKEIPRFRDFRRSRQEIWHECKDVDLAVWLSRLDNLKALQLARGRALNKLMTLHGIGIAHHQVDTFLVEPGTNRYLGRLCDFGVCPKGKPECQVSRCGESPFLQQHEGFRFRSSSLNEGSSVILFDRELGLCVEAALPKPLVELRARDTDLDVPF